MATCSPLSPADLDGGLAAMAAYAHGLKPGMSKKDFADALVAADFTREEAESFANEHEIVYALESVTGAGIAVFKNVDTQEITFAIDGTDPSGGGDEAIGDILTDIKLATEGPQA